MIVLELELELVLELDYLELDLLWFRDWDWDRDWDWEDRGKTPSLFDGTCQTYQFWQYSQSQWFLQNFFVEQAEAIKNQGSQKFAVDVEVDVAVRGGCIGGLWTRIVNGGVEFGMTEAAVL